jgi:ergothioneine biosynthesis protein EgtB
MDQVKSVKSQQEHLLESFRRTRETTLQISSPLEIEDMVIQADPDTSPAKWHLAHTTWFFEKMVADKYIEGYRSFNDSFDLIFNSYYEGLGRYFPRNRRGTLSRPTVSEILEYRNHLDSSIQEALMHEALALKALSMIELGINHEQQHEELMLMDIKLNFFNNPLHIAYRKDTKKHEIRQPADMKWMPFKGGVYEIGYDGMDFSFDNERPRHKVWIDPFSVASRTVTNAEYLEFMSDGGYSRPELWLSDGWSIVKRDNLEHPLYWLMETDYPHEFSLSGIKRIVPYEPVCNISYFEADAYARWAGKRLLSEAEWEVAFSGQHISEMDNFLESDILGPIPAKGNGLSHGFGNLWEWTQSSYLPFPGSKPDPGAISEYNHKFMSGQMVLKGGSFATPRDHFRPSYRNFFQPDKRWAFTGIRLAESI